MSEQGAAVKSWQPLTPKERRVLGVLVEKAKTTPDNYPMTIAAIVTGCNQKTNRFPVTNYDQDTIEDILHDLRGKGAAIMVESGGRVTRWKHTLYEWFKVSKVELAILGELMLRGPQTEGDLRARANRMSEREPINDLGALQSLLTSLEQRGLVQYLTPPGQKRGAIITHALYPPAETERVKTEWAGYVVQDDEPKPAAAPTPPPIKKPAASLPELAYVIPPSVDELEVKVQTMQADQDALKNLVSTLQAELKALRDEFHALKRDLGA